MKNVGDWEDPNKRWTESQMGGKSKGTEREVRNKLQK
jgi:hypothetical protein